MDAFKSILLVGLKSECLGGHCTSSICGLAGNMKQADMSWAESIPIRFPA